jgi:hypothetical protein
MQNLVEFSQLGVGIFAIAALVLVVLRFFKFMGNHFKHNTEVMQRLCDAVIELRDYVKYLNGKK